MTAVTLLRVEDCPTWRAVHADLLELADEHDATVDVQLVRTPEDAERLTFHGSPTVLVDGIDPFATGDEPVGLACRIYDTPDGPAGRPTRDQLREALR